MSLNDLNTLPALLPKRTLPLRNSFQPHHRARQGHREVADSIPACLVSNWWTSDFVEAKFSLYFLALVDPATIPADDDARHQWMKSIPGVLELTHNHGTERDADFAYHDGNTDPRGFGHICVSVPDVVAACERFEALQVPFQKRLSDGRMNHLAFIKDPMVTGSK
nr:glyoxalase I [Pseudomonas putida]prf//1413189A glyoxalase I [Pseudomonas putida]